MIEIAEQSGVNVVFADFGEHKEKVAGYCDFRSSRLYVNHEERRVRQNFTIAHELGHWLLHKDLFENDPDKHVVLPRFSKPDTNDPLELEANTFAANLLVPDRLLRPVASGFVQIKTLMRLFDVSRTMMEWRLWELRQ
ncbi:MAG: ImmA/IrrE family metallo-endopeptidase [Bacteroidetes bacterium]|nr:ImmA/IrrE family metallo-endopeptidase [Bacteroidota bacterium]